MYIMDKTHDGHTIVKGLRVATKDHGWGTVTKADAYRARYEVTDDDGTARVLAHDAMAVAAHVWSHDMPLDPRRGEVAYFTVNGVEIVEGLRVMTNEARWGTVLARPESGYFDGWFEVAYDGNTRGKSFDGWRLTTSPPAQFPRDPKGGE